MSRLGKSVVLFTLGAMLAYLFTGGRVAQAASLPTAPVTGYAVAQGPMELELLIAPPVATPGGQIDIILTATNRTAESRTPLVAVPIPDDLTLVTGILPAGTSYDLTSRTISWQPFLSDQQSQERVKLTFSVGAAVLAQPVRSFSVYPNADKPEESLTATYWVGLPPSATILVSPIEASVGQPVQLLARVEGSGPIAQVWETGDHRQLEANDPVVVYPVAGTYEVVLRAANPLAATTARATVNVVETPDASFAPDDPTPGAGQLIRFVNQSGGQPPLTFLWDFGDGISSNDREPTHAYGTAGDYLVSLTVLSGDRQDSFVWPLTVGAAPVLRLEVPATVTAGEEVMLQAFVDGGVGDVEWDMGDGAVLHGNVVRHAFALGGERVFSVRATNPYGEAVIQQSLSVVGGTSTAVFVPLFFQAGMQSAPTVEATEPSSTRGNVTTILAERPYEAFEPVVLEQALLPEGASEAEQLFWYINEARRLHNLPPLEYLHPLSVAAQRHAEDMATNQFTGHRGSDGSMPYERLPQYGFEGHYGGEATAWGFDDARQAVEFWVNSPGHRRIILNDRAVSLGVGYRVDFKAPNLWYWVAEIGQKGDDEK